MFERNPRTVNPAAVFGGGFSDIDDFTDRHAAAARFSGQTFGYQRAGGRRQLRPDGGGGFFDADFGVCLPQIITVIYFEPRNISFDRVDKGVYTYIAVNLLLIAVTVINPKYLMHDVEMMLAAIL